MAMAMKWEDNGQNARGSEAKQSRDCSKWQSEASCIAKQDGKVLNMRRSGAAATPQPVQSVPASAGAESPGPTT